ncbi:uncharacterized protein LOC111303352 [Durio zibethinus]|uniref:Uncharacterized protein LOC111303352 n=1 Tax=Durio zibethinus TaxID=66656 RepID=A0A6P5ZS64_DURZI|nr:uncharacterized protein LOC111303352 [Durio zibethinus]
MCCTLASTTKRLKQHMLYHTTLLIAKLDPIKYIFEKPSLSERIVRWQVLLFKYNIAYVSQKAIKESVITEFLVDRATKDYEPMKFDFLYKKLMAILESEEDDDEEKTRRMYFNGAANAMGHEIEVVLISSMKHYYLVTARLNFNCTNNVVEYEACVIGLHIALDSKGV